MLAVLVTMVALVTVGVVMLTHVNTPALKWGFTFLRTSERRTTRPDRMIVATTATTPAAAATPRSRSRVPMRHFLLKQPIMGVSPWWNINDLFVENGKNRERLDRRPIVLFN